MREPGSALQFDVMGTGQVRLLFVHGFLDAARIWDPVRRQLANVGIASAAVDLPGMGGTPADLAGLSLDSYADAVAATATALGQGIVLVGQSLGTQVVELAALRSPDISGLVLLTPVPLGGVGLPDEMLVQFRALGESLDGQREQRAALSHSLSDNTIQDLVALGASVRPEIVSRLVDIWNEGHELGRAPSSFTGPVLIIRGSADPFVQKEMAEGVAARFPAAPVASVDAAGHWVHVEQPEQVAALLIGFVSAIGSPRPTAAAAGDWKDAFARKTSEAFGSAFADDIILEASTLVAPVHGRDAVQKVMEAASSVYASLDFTEQATSGNKQYVEWVATAHEGVEFRGVTVLTRNVSGAIAHVAIHHRPMEAAIFFSRLLGEKLKHSLPAGHFLERDLLKTGEAA